MKDKPLTVTLYIGEKRVDSLTEEQAEKMAKRLSDTMSTYYTANRKEFKDIK